MTAYRHHNVCARRVRLAQHGEQRLAHALRQLAEKCQVQLARLASEGSLRGLRTREVTRRRPFMNALSSRRH